MVLSKLGEAFDRAFLYASHVHGGDIRKHTEIPYMSHLMSVCALVLEAGGSETQAIAALLHDAAEDFGGEGRLADIRTRFGDGVADIVETCSDSLVTDPSKKPDWRTRKKVYIAHLDGALEDALLVSLADKLHNARAIYRDQRLLGDTLFSRFTMGKDDPRRGRAATEWYYDELAQAFAGRSEVFTPEGQLLVGELGEIVNAIMRHSQPITAEERFAGE